MYSFNDFFRLTELQIYKIELSNTIIDNFLYNMSPPVTYNIHKTSYLALLYNFDCTLPKHYYDYLFFF